MKNKLNLLCLAALLAAGCLSSSSRINTVSLGMDKAAVLKIMGTPVSVAADTNSEYLNYTLAEGPMRQIPVPYTVKLEGNKVVAYGRAGSPILGQPGPMVVPIVQPVAVH